MNDWRGRAQMTRRDMVRVAAAILGLLIGCIALLWVLTRFIPRRAPSQPPPVGVKPTPPPVPRTGQ